MRPIVAPGAVPPGAAGRYTRPTFRLASISFAAALLAAALVPGTAADDPAAAAPDRRPSIVLVLTDDQRRDTLAAMPAVRRELVGRGVTFTQAVAVNPLCCPSRATILTGDHSHTTGVWVNDGPHGGSDWFDHDATIGRRLQEAGYRTAYVGKYLNNYGGWAPPALDRWFVPPGWDLWLGSGGGEFDYPLSVHGLMTRFQGQEPHFTDLVFDAAVSFVEEDDERPFFVVVAPYAPHHPAFPAARHAGALGRAEPWRPPAYDEPDVSDKPAWVRGRAELSQGVERRLDALRRRQLESLLAVDEGVARIVGSLRAGGRLAETMVVLASDNGLHWGEHRLANRKGTPYEESVRIPLVVRYDALVPGPRMDDRLVGNLDLAPTFAELAGAEVPRMDGESLVPLLAARPGREPRWRARILLESLQGELGAAGEVPTFCAVRDRRFKYVVYATGEEELYDLAADPHELENLASHPARRARLAELRADLVRLCRPAPPDPAMRRVLAGLRDPY